MPNIDKHPAGAPCWFELASSDQNAAKAFYGQLFGWSIVDHPMGPNEVYTLFQIEGRDVCALYTLQPDMVQQGVPPHWAVYFAVDDVDAAAAKVPELGGSMICGPFDVMEHGRMAACKDPGGAVFQLWQPRAHPGSRIMGDVNTVCWAELATWDVDKVRSFYTSLLGWQTAGSASAATYIEYSAGGQPRGGLMPMDEQWKGIPSHWGIYFLVDDCDAVAARIKELGGMIRMGPFDAHGVGRLAICADPQGAGFSIIQLAGQPH